MQGPGLQKASDGRRFSAQRLRLVCDRFPGRQFGSFDTGYIRGCPGQRTHRRRCGCHCINVQRCCTCQRTCRCARSG